MALFVLNFFTFIFWLGMNRPSPFLNYFYPVVHYLRQRYFHHVCVFSKYQILILWPILYSLYFEYNDSRAYLGNFVLCLKSLFKIVHPSIRLAIDYRIHGSWFGLCVWCLISHGQHLSGICSKGIKADYYTQVIFSIWLEWLQTQLPFRLLPGFNQRSYTKEVKEHWFQ